MSATSTAAPTSIQRQRLKDPNWKLWGPYLSDRQWGTVREDYSRDGSAWEYFPHDVAHQRAYRWGEDGIGGISDNEQRLCLSFAFWNGNDPILKERLFGLTGNEGNHGEDVKELYYYLDNIPTHSYMRMLYKYPHSRFPHELLREKNRERGKNLGEFELVDSGVFDDNRYFDLTIEYAKAGPEDIFGRVTCENRGSAAHTIYVIPQAWFRNTWSWAQGGARGRLSSYRENVVLVEHPTLGTLYFHFQDEAEILLCENETNVPALFGAPKTSGYYKDGLDEAIVHQNSSAAQRDGFGTKCGAPLISEVQGGGRKTSLVRLSRRYHRDPFRGAAEVFRDRQREADEFYAELQHSEIDREVAAVHRQAYAGLLWLNNSTTTMYRSGFEAIQLSPLRPRNVAAEGTTRGSISTTRTSFSCQTNGSTRGTRLRTWRFTAFRARSLIQILLRSNSFSLRASDTCIRTASCQRTSGPSAM